MTDKPTYQDMEKRVQELEKQLYERELFLKNIPDHVIIQDLEQRVLWANNTAADSIDKKLEDILGHYCYEVWQQRNEPCEGCPILKTIKTGKVKELETLTPNGHAYRIHGYPMYDQKGKIIGAFEYGRDITERRNFEEALQKSEEKYRGIVENANEGIVITQNGMFKFINSKTSEISGYSQQELMSKPFIEIVYPDDKSMVMQHHIKRLKGEEIPGRYELRFVAKDGSVKWIENNGVIVGWEGNPATLNFITDITDRKQVEQALRESEERFRAIFESAQDFIFIKDSFLKYTHVNPAMEKLFQLKAKELVGKTDEDLFGENAGDHIREVDVRVLAGEIVQEEHTKPVHETPITFNLIKVPLRDHLGKIVGLCGIAHDITERKQKEEALRKSHEMLKRTEAMANIGSWEWDVQHDQVHWSEELFRIFGRHPAEGEHPFAEQSEFYVNEDFQCLRDAVETCVKQGTSYEIEVRAIRTDGEIRHCVSRGQPQYDENGKVFRIFGSFQDITDRKQTEEVLKLNYELLHIAGETAMFGGWSVDLEKNICTWSDAVADIHDVPHGYAPPVQEAINFYAPEWREKIIQCFSACAKDGIPYDEGMEIITQKGKRVWVRATGKAVKNEKDEIIKVQGSFQDITELKRTEEALKDKNEEYEALNEELRSSVEELQSAKEELQAQNEELQQVEASLRYSEALFRNLVDGSPDGIFVQSKGRFLFLNPAMVRFFGAESAEELLGTDFMARMAPEYREDIQNRIRFQRENRKPAPLMDQEFLRLDGSRVPVETTAVAIQYKGHGAHLVFVRDITERKKHEEILKLQALVLDQICDLVTITDMDGVISYVNQAQTKVLGYGKEALIGHSTQIFGEDSLKSVSQKEIVEKTVKNGFWRGEVVNFDKSGQEHIMDCRIQVIVDEQGAPTALCGVATDVTVYKRSEKALLESEVKFRTLMNQAPAALFLHDMDGNIVDVNKATLNHYGYTLKQLLKMKSKDIDPDYIEREDKGVFWKQLKEKQSIQFEGRHRRSDGSIFPVSVSLSPIVLKGKNHIFALAIDITDYKNAQEKLIESEERFRTVFEQAAVGVARVSPNGGFLEINDKFCQLVGYNNHELHKMTFRDITHPDDLYLDENYVEQVLAGKINSFDIEKRYIHKNGHPVWVRLYSNVVRNIGGEIKYAVAVVTDISERKLVEEEREKLQNQLNQAQKLESIGNLAGGIAHDFNNILFPIVGMSEMLLEDLPPGSPERENAGEIYKAGMRGSDLVKQILAFSRQSEHKLIPTRIQNVLKEVLKLSRASIPSYIEIDQKIQQDCGMVMADPSQIHQIGMNIITNAFHAVEDKGGKISVQLRETVLGDSGPAISNMESGKYAVLSISDTGHGMSEELIGKIFDPYFTTKEQGKGTGLGLAIVYGIIKEHGGHIKVHSEIGKGTTFDVYLPMMDVSSRVETGNAAGQIQTGSERILLVDDEQSIANLEKQMLERLGYKVTMCVKSLEALEVFNANPDLFDLVISDMTMPSMTGDQLACKLIAIRPDIPIIICTGFSERLNQEKAEALGIKGFLMKPVVKSDMAQMVRKVLDEARCINKS